LLRILFLKHIFPNGFHYSPFDLHAARLPSSVQIVNDDPNSVSSLPDSQIHTELPKHHCPSQSFSRYFTTFDRYHERSSGLELAIKTFRATLPMDILFGRYQRPSDEKLTDSPAKNEIENRLDFQND
jgi:hypothetical protein